jgi:hypothetical protein
VEQIPSDEAAVLAFLGRFAEPSRLRVCYEAGPTGYELARLLHRQGVACQVIAPSLIRQFDGDLQVGGVTWALRPRADAGREAAPQSVDRR